MTRAAQHRNYKNNWATPSDIVYKINLSLILSRKHPQEKALSLDVAASGCNAKASRYFNENDDGLKQSWRCLNYWWCNPPFKRIQEFLEKAHAEFEKGHEGIFLVPNSAETQWFRKYITDHNLPRLVWQKRIAFIDPDTGKPATGNVGGSCLVAFVKDRDCLTSLEGQPWVVNLK